MIFCLRTSRGLLSLSPDQVQRDAKTEDVNTLTAQADQLTADIAKLTQELADLAQEITELDAAAADYAGIHFWLISQVDCLINSLMFFKQNFKKRWEPPFTTPA